MDAKQFYPKLHTEDKTYAAGTYNVDALLSIRAMRDFLSGFPQRPFRVLDVGCGKGFFLREFLKEVRNRFGIKQIEPAGVDLVRSPGNFHHEISENFKFTEINLDGGKLPFPDRSLDFLCCNHVLEHIFETEKLIREFHRVLDPGGICVVSVPNTACWSNRILFLFAGQPLGSEVGTEKVTYGFWPGFMQKKLEQFNPSGHIRDFTPRGLSDLTTHCGFRTVGWWAQSLGLVPRLGKWAGRNVGIVLKPA